MKRHLVGALAALAALTLGFVVYVASGADDCYIAMWSAYALVEFGEIVNYNGARVEQSSSLLYTLILAVASLVTRAPLPLLGYWCGVVFGGLAALRTPTLARRLRWGESAWLVLLVGTAPCLLFWCFGSLETTIVAWLSVEVAVLATDIAARRRGVFSPVTVVLTLAYVLVRPEAAIVLGTCLIGGIALGLLGRRLGRRTVDASPIAPLLRWFLLVIVLFTSLGVLRLLYFGEIFPQPVAMKSGGDLLSGVVRGAKYVAKFLVLDFGLATASGLLAVPLVAIMEVRKPRWELDRLLVILLIATNASFVVTSGGDWMPAGRFFAHFVPLVVVVLYGLGVDARLSRRAAGAIVGLWVITNVAGTLLVATHRSAGRPIWAFIEKNSVIRDCAHGGDYAWPERANQAHTRDMLFLSGVWPILEELLEERETVTVMSVQAGMNAFYITKRFYGRIEFIDLAALSTRHFESLADEIGLRTTSVGLVFPMERFFTEARTREGPQWSPDIICGIFTKSAEVADRHGYRIVHVQVGVTTACLERTDAALYPVFGPRGIVAFKNRLSIYQFLAVRDDLADRFEPSRFDWDQERLARLGDPRVSRELHP